MSKISSLYSEFLKNNEFISLGSDIVWSIVTVQIIHCSVAQNRTVNSCSVIFDRTSLHCSVQFDRTVYFLFSWPQPNSQ